MELATAFTLPFVGPAWLGPGLASAGIFLEGFVSARIFPEVAGIFLLAVGTVLVEFCFAFSLSLLDSFLPFLSFLLADFFSACFLLLFLSL